MKHNEQNLQGNPKPSGNISYYDSIHLKEEMCKEMVEEDHKAARRMALLREHNLELPVSIES